MTTTVHIVATGARTPIGLSSASSAASYRAGISGIGEHPFLIDQVGDPMPGALDARLNPSITGPERLLAMAETALLEACAPIAEARFSHVRLPVYLGLPEIRPGFTSQDAETIRSGLARLAELPIEVSAVNIFKEGHAAGLSALARANEQIQNGAIESCLVGGVDSYFHPDTMEWLDENRQLAGTVSRSGFVPGEGAGFCLLMSEATRVRLGLDSLARVLAVGVGREENLIKTTDICLGRGLTSVVQSAISSLSHSSKKINTVICDMNGERYRGEEWGFVCLRLSQHFDDPTAYLSPADCWGDMGAASGTLFAMLACRAVVRGYAEGPRTLLWAGSECGLRGAALIESSVEA
jgi:3-oxoacyl-[acyl-carrier-protein] synthase-1